MSELQEIPIWLLLLLFLGLFAQSTFLFVHGRRNGHFYWFWGLWGMTTMPMPIVLYFVYIKWIKPYRERKLANDH